MLKDTFEPAKKGPRAAVAPLSPTEQIFWRIVRMDAELTRCTEELKTSGRFDSISGASNYISYRFLWNGSPRSFDAQITPNTNAIQIRNFLNTCAKGVKGIFEQPNIRPYLRPNRRPL